ncbi:hypothetical protein TNIN_279101 [Trichonephila inaurata madagascariensis]|uniref:Uncharacterized protein n=1 Tax=Trichonephila inaurata madagascariensis TaxID=2747483 RepID=A0A8X6YPJ1_9ARAC|nr:hypothetical protein TNIN_279101 [Trichonephila inaurata madagascariensis]
MQTKAVFEQSDATTIRLHKIPRKFGISNDRLYPGADGREASTIRRAPLLTSETPSLSFPSTILELRKPEIAVFSMNIFPGSRRPLGIEQTS